MGCSRAAALARERTLALDNQKQIIGVFCTQRGKVSADASCGFRSILLSQHRGVGRAQLFLSSSFENLSFQMVSGSLFSLVFILTHLKLNYDIAVS